MAEDTGTELFFQKKYESGEAEELDTSEEEVEEEEAIESEEESEEEESDESEEEPEDEDVDWKEVAEKREDQRKEWQSRYDTDKQAHANEMSQMRNEINQLKEKQDSKEIDDIFDGKDPDDIMTVAEAKKLKDKITKPKPPPQADDFNAWSQSQPDYQQISEYYANLKSIDPTIDSKIPGATSQDAYISLRQWMHEDDVKVLREENEKLKKQNRKIKKSKPKAPVSGQGPGVSGGTRSSGRDPEIHSFFQKPWNK